MFQFTLTKTQQKCCQLQHEFTELHNCALEQLLLDQSLNPSYFVTVKTNVKPKQTVMLKQKKKASNLMLILVCEYKNFLFSR